MSFIQRVGRIARSRRGTSAIIFAAALAAIMPVVGFVVDHAMYLNHKSKVQSALDFASIAAARHLSNNLAATDQEVQTLANDFFKAELEGFGYLNMNDVQVARMGSRLNLDVDGNMPTTFMHLAGVDKMSLYTDAEVVYGVPTKAEIALVLDTSKSMTNTDPGQTTSRIESLREAAQDMVDTLMVDDDGTIDVKMALVPFSNRVNVGTGNKNKAWISIPDKVEIEQLDCHIPDSWYKDNCVAGLIECDDDGVNEGCFTWICDPIEEQNAEPVCIDNKREFTWHGCVQPRTDTYHLTDGDYSTEQIPGFLSEDAKQCASPVEKVTSDPSRIKRGIRKMNVRSDTYIPTGLIWGYRMLTPEAPFRADKSVREFMKEGGIKSILLMSDGENMLAPDVDGELGDDDGTLANPNTKEVCDMIKQTGVEIYVVAYNIADPDTTELLKDCASSATRFYTADTTDSLKGVFESISKKIGRDISLAG